MAGEERDVSKSPKVAEDLDPVWAKENDCEPGGREGVMEFVEQSGEDYGGTRETEPEASGDQTEQKVTVDQHKWDEVTLRARVTETLNANDELTEHQRAQLLEVILRHKQLLIAKDLGTVDFEYHIEVPPHRG